jgi:hypothetical protein
MTATVAGVGIAQAQAPQGAIVGWGSQVVGVDLSAGFVAVAAGGSHSLGLKTDGSIVAWGDNSSGQTNVPSPNSGFVGVAVGYGHSDGLKDDGAIVAWGHNFEGDGDVDLADLTRFANCLSGPGRLSTPTAPNTTSRCLGAFDRNADGDIDLGDFAVVSDLFEA